MIKKPSLKDPFANSLFSNNPTHFIANKVLDSMEGPPDPRTVGPNAETEGLVSGQIARARQEQDAINKEMLEGIQENSSATRAKNLEDASWQTSLGGSPQDALKQALDQRLQRQQEADLNQLNRIQALQSPFQRAERLKQAQYGEGALDAIRNRNAMMKNQAAFARYQARMGVISGLLGIGGQVLGMGLGGPAGAAVAGSAASGGGVQPLQGGSASAAQSPSYQSQAGLAQNMVA